MLALVSGDADSFHVSGDGAVRPDTSTTESAGAEAFIAAALGTRLPRPGMRILRENLLFRGRLAVGDELTATEKRGIRRGRVRLPLLQPGGGGAGRRTVTVAASTQRVTYAEVAPN